MSNLKNKENNTQYIEIETINNVVTLTFKGEIDAFTVTQFREYIDKYMIDSSYHGGVIILDLTQVSFIDSHAVGLFVSLLKRAHKAETKLVFVGVEGQPKSILKIVGFNEDIVCYTETMEGALSINTL